MKTRTFAVVIRKEEDIFIAECPEVGTVSQGNTIKEAIENLKEATELYLEEFPLEYSEKPLVTFFEVTSNAPAEKGIRGKTA
ncbi:MAG TPA: type II toxin-antitoxin system HicB family antitoxin [Candidatus Nanoarchaeia archaeon]|nr:type II toxin-antitoxin system HicB family antitoxin [Candidatus Nanoarchaeia archaeon]